MRRKVHQYLCTTHDASGEVCCVELALGNEWGVWRQVALKESKMPCSQKFRYSVLNSALCMMLLDLTCMMVMNPRSISLSLMRLLFPLRLFTDWLDCLFAARGPHCSPRRGENKSTNPLANATQRVCQTRGGIALNLVHAAGYTLAGIRTRVCSGRAATIHYF